MLGIRFLANGERVTANRFKLLGRPVEGERKAYLLIWKVMLKCPSEWSEIRIAGNEDGDIEDVLLCEREDLTGHGDISFLFFVDIQPSV